MWDTPLKYNLKLKTGFFKTEQYILSLQKEGLKLTCADRDIVQEEILINYESIKTISICGGLTVEIEIRTDKSTYVGTFPKSADINELIRHLKVVLEKKLI